MDVTTIPWSEISLGSAIVIALIVMIKAQSKSTENLVKKFGETNALIAQQLTETRSDYKSFVMQNNHTTTELVKESTTAITKSAEMMGRHTQAVEKLVDKLNK